MRISEETRHRLYNRLEEVLGGDEAATLMAYLPPAGWADFATKDDLKSLATSFGASLHAEFGGLRSEIAKLPGDVAAQIRAQFFALVGLQFSAAGLALACTKLL